MNETDLINVLILIKMIEMAIGCGMLIYLLYLFVKSLTWQKVKKEVREYTPVLSVVFIIALTLSSTVFCTFS